MTLAAPIERSVPEAALQAWLQRVLPGVTVIYSDQDAPVPQAPFVRLAFGGGDMIGGAEVVVDDSRRPTVRTHQEADVIVEVVGITARSLAGHLIRRHVLDAGLLATLGVCVTAMEQLGVERPTVGVGNDFKVFLSVSVNWIEDWKAAEGDTVDVIDQVVATGTVDDLVVDVAVPSWENVDPAAAFLLLWS